MGLIAVLLLVLLVSVISSVLIARKMYNVLVKEQNRWAALLCILTFIGSLAIILFVVNWVFLSQVNLGR
jgi:hypothetical protein